MPDSLPRFQRSQYDFAAHIRDPERNPPPADVRPERMRMYRELFVNNIESFIAAGFPVLRQVLDEVYWRAMVHDFFAGHRCKTPYFAGIPEEFLDYLRDERGERPEDPPYLLELAHYEWVELALSVVEAEAPAEEPGQGADPLSSSIVLSDLAWPLAYRFPVHRISRDYQPADAPATPTFLAVYRDRRDEVRFLELNPVSFRLLQLLEQDGVHPAEDYLRQIADELGYADPSPILVHGAETLRELARRGLIGVV